MSLPQPGSKKVQTQAGTKSSMNPHKSAKTPDLTSKKVPPTVGRASKSKVHSNDKGMTTNDTKLGEDSMVDVEQELAAPITENSILVVATAKGYYGNLRREPGEKFYVENAEHLGSWMEVIGE